MLEDIKKIHFVGIGGVGMSALAQLLISMGYQVSGSDTASNSYTRKLAGMGAKIHKSHRADNLMEAEAVIYSTAISAKNPELKFAAQKGIPCFHRGALLTELMNARRGIAVTGTHGKTTTAAMLSVLLLEGGLDPVVAVGGSQAGIGGNARFGRGRYFVCEADESDGSFLELDPRFAVITNIENDHLEHYGSFSGLKAAFGSFAGKVYENGGIIAFSDHPVNIEVLGGLNREQSIVYGFGDNCQVRARNFSDTFGASSFSVVAANRELGDIELQLPGIYNVYNSLGAISIAVYLGVEFQGIKRALSSFAGVERRFQKMGEVNGISVIEDYAHHPGGLFSMLASARKHGRRIISVFQPHRFTRTQQLIKDLGASLSASDVVIVTDIYSAGEEPINGLSSADIVEGISAYGHPAAFCIPDKNMVPGKIAEIARCGDLVLILGAGDINEITPGVLEKLETVKRG